MDLETARIYADRAIDVLGMLAAAAKHDTTGVALCAGLATLLLTITMLTFRLDPARPRVRSRHGL